MPGKIIKKLFAFFFSFISLITTAQTGLIAYTHDYEFNEGLFLTVNDFKQNDPIPKSSIVSGVPKSLADFLKQVIEQKFIVFKDSSGKEQKLETASLWGYCQNRTVYINFNKEFNLFVLEL